MSVIAAALKPRSVLIPTDFSAAAGKALQHALAIARFYGSKFCLGHVVSSLGLTLAGPNAIAGCEDAVSRDTARLKESLIQTGALSGLQHKFIVRQGEVWPELREIIQQENIDLVVVGTNGRQGFGKLFRGSIAEQIFRQSDCPVLTFGPGACESPWLGSSCSDRRFLFATDFGEGSLNGLRQAIAAANQFRAKLNFLSIIPAVPLSQCRASGSGGEGDLGDVREEARMRTLRRLANLANSGSLDVLPEFHAEFASLKPISESILEAAESIRADLIIMGLHDSAHSGLISHLPWATAYEVICHASGPVLTVNARSRDSDVPPRITNAEDLLVSEADTIRIHGVGVKW
jgi:nucleotide-binding universal stress UspA family protein